MSPPNHPSIGSSNWRLWELYGRYAQREDFAVVLQPFFRNTIVPLNNDGKPDLSFFAIDCFHFSERGHAEMAIALWNNMLEPVGHKQSYNNFTYGRTKLKCPTTSCWPHDLEVDYRQCQLFGLEMEISTTPQSWTQQNLMSRGNLYLYLIGLTWRLTHHLPSYSVFSKHMLDQVQ
uniref:Uncharacterized protein n=1 Tax=Anolis carolinensis TaxID=28377 RepID=A0A803TI29_ANOCA